MPLMKPPLTLKCLPWTCLAYPVAHTFFLGCLCVLRPGLPSRSGPTVWRLAVGACLTSIPILEVSCRTWPSQACFLSVATTQVGLTEMPVSVWEVSGWVRVGPEWEWKTLLPGELSQLLSRGVPPRPCHTIT